MSKMPQPVAEDLPVPPAAAPVAPQAENLAEDLVELQAQAAQLDATTTPAMAAMQAAQQQAQSTSEAEWVAVIVGIGTPAAAILAPNWQIQPAELQALGQAWAPILQQYFPEGVGAMGPWPGAILATAMVVGPRLRLPRHTSVPEEEGGSAPGQNGGTAHA